MFLGWILAARIIHLLSRLITETDSFEQTISVLSFGISIVSWSTGRHDILTSFLGALHIISQRDYETDLNSPTLWRTLLCIQMIIYLTWFVVLFSKGLKAVYLIKTWQAGIFGTADL